MISQKYFGSKHYFSSQSDCGMTMPLAIQFKNSRLKILEEKNPHTVIHSTMGVKPVRLETIKYIIKTMCFMT